MRSHILRKTTSWLLMLLLLLAFPAHANAVRPEGEPLKGLIPASSCLLEEMYRADCNAYDPIPVEVETIFVGLSYDRSSVEEVELENEDGLGFRFGRFDDQRVFQADSETEASDLIIRVEKNWYVLLDEIFSSEEDAKSVAYRYTGRVVDLDGNCRVLVGPLLNEQDAGFTIRWHALNGRVWRESCLAVYDGSGHFIKLYADADDLAIEPVSVGKARTDYDGLQYYGSFRLRLSDDDRITVINAVGLEDYVKGVVPYEMSPEWPFEALKAQAVCARSYAAYNLGAYAEEYGFDLTDDTESQVYRGLNRADAVTDAAVDATAGQFVRFQGKLCEVYYFAADGGATEDGVNIFGSEQPYLVGKTDPFEPALEIAKIRWELLRSGDEIADRLQKKGYEIGSVTKLETVCSELGNVIAVHCFDAQGNCVELNTRDEYSLLSLDSACFTVKAVEDGFLFTGRGWGHNCGMSQWGAYAMASVYGYSAEDMIGFYFSGAYIG